MKKLMSAVLSATIMFNSIAFAYDGNGNMDISTDSVVSGSAVSVESDIAPLRAAANDQWQYYVQSGNVTIQKYLGTDENVVIPSAIEGLPVTAVGSNGNNGIFEGKFIKSVEIPSSVKNITDYAFRDCTALTSVKLSEGLTNIGYCAFSGCTSLSSITIPSTVTKYESDTFYGCTSLADVTINSGADLSSSMFSGCKSLRNVTFNKSVAIIGDYAFENCISLRNIAFKDGLVKIGSDYNLKEVKCLSSKGTVDVQNIVYGDINFDGAITSMDASQALLHSVGIKTLTGNAFLASDVNHDGKITSIDASLILLASLGLRKL